MSKDKLIKKLAALKATEVSLRDTGHLEAAESYAAKVTELLLRHQLSMDEIEIAARDKDDPIGEEYVHGTKNKRIWWQERLAGEIALANTCRILVIPGRNTVIFVGREQNRQVCSYLFRYLCREVEPFCNKEYDRFYNSYYLKGQPVPPGWRKSFYTGFLCSIRDRFQEMKQSVKEDVGEDAFAMVVTEEKAVSNWIDENVKGKAESMQRHRSENPEGFKAGKEYGGKVPLHRGVGAGEGGQKALGEK